MPSPDRQDARSAAWWRHDCRLNIRELPATTLVCGHCCARKPSAATKLGTVAKLTCSKCGGEDILVRWHTGGRYGTGGCGYYAKVVEAGEHLHHTCRTCQYEWTGVPADAE